MSEGFYDPSLLFLITGDKIIREVYADMATDDKKQGNQQQQNPQQQTGGARQAQRRQIRFVEEGVKTLYSGVFNIGFGSDEVVFIFGNPSVDPNVVRIESKVAVSLKTAKRMAITLSDMLRRYEAQNGVIDISAPKGKADATEQDRIKTATGEEAKKTH